MLDFICKHTILYILVIGLILALPALVMGIVLGAFGAPPWAVVAVIMIVFVIGGNQCF